MRRFRLASILALAALLAIPAAAGPKRVVSVNLCTDYLALLLAEPGQIASLTFMARDPWLNPEAARAGAIPINRGSAEEVLSFAPDLVLASAGQAGPTLALLRGLGIKVVEIPLAQSLETMPESISQVAAALGRQEAGAELIARIRAMLQAAEVARPAQGASAAILGPGGEFSRDDTLGASILKAAGFHLPDAERSADGRVSIETLILSRPDVLVISPPEAQGSSLSEAMLAHPALFGRGAPRVLRIGPAAFMCDGPAAAQAALELARRVAP